MNFWKNIHSKRKVVFSGKAAADERAVFINTDISGKISQLKAETEKHLWLYGGASLIKSFIQLGLIDVYRISVHPIALGAGKPLFEELQQRLTLKLLSATTFRSGVVQLIYEPLT